MGQESLTTSLGGSDENEHSTNRLEPPCRVKCSLTSSRLGTKRRKPSLVYCGDARGKKIAVELIRDVGFDPVDAGPLRIARYTEPFTLLIAQLAYEGDEGPELAYRFERFGRKP